MFLPGLRMPQGMCLRADSIPCIAKVIMIIIIHGINLDLATDVAVGKVKGVIIAGDCLALAKL